MDHDKWKSDDLHGPELNKPIWTYNIRLSKIDIAIIDDGVKVSILIKFKLTLEIHVEILDRNCHFTVASPQPVHDFLVRLNNKVLVSWEIKDKKAVPLIIIYRELDFIKLYVGISILDIAPIYLSIEIFNSEPAVPDGVFNEETLVGRS